MNEPQFSVETVTPLQLKEMLAQDNPPIVIDVRQEEELMICSLPNVLNIPLGRLPRQLDRVPENRVLIILCHRGYRSAQAVMFLKSQGFCQVFSVKGGIKAWTEQVDPTLMQY